MRSTPLSCRNPFLSSFSTVDVPFSPLLLLNVLDFTANPAVLIITSHCISLIRSTIWFIQSYKHCCEAWQNLRGSCSTAFIQEFQLTDCLPIRNVASSASKPRLPLWNCSIPRFKNYPLLSTLLPTPRRILLMPSTPQNILLNHEIWSTNMRICICAQYWDTVSPHYLYNTASAWNWPRCCWHKFPRARYPFFYVLFEDTLSKDWISSHKFVLVCICIWKLTTELLLVIGFP